MDNRTELEKKDKCNHARLCTGCGGKATHITDDDQPLCDYCWETYLEDNPNL